MKSPRPSRSVSSAGSFGSVAARTARPEPVSVSERSSSSLLAASLSPSFVRENVHPEAVVDEGTGGSFLPDAEVLHGPDGFWTSVRKGTDLFDDVRIELVDHEEAGDLVLVAMRVMGVGRGSGAPLDFVRHDVYGFRDGMIVSVALFAERDDALRSLE